MERDLTDWEVALVTALASVDVPGAHAVRESIPELVALDVCLCGCRSFEMRDRRRAAAPWTQELSTAQTVDHTASYSLLVDDDGRPAAVSDLAHGGEVGPAPDPDSLVVSAAGLPARWRWVGALVVVVAGGLVFAWSVLNGYGPDTSGEDTCAVHASIVERDRDRQEWFQDRCVDAVPVSGR